jgi:2-oxoisovalerate dehydrogenase E1 component
MFFIRRFEERCLELSGEKSISGSIHLCAGQEAVPVGAMEVLQPTDRVVATYRGHGWALACGVPPREVLAEICHRELGVNGGRGGSAYLCSLDHGFVGENSIVGAGAAIASGVALAAQLHASRRVVVVSFGDGALNQGATHEAMVFAASRSLPVIFLCENNGWSEMTPIASMVRNERLAERASAYGFASSTVDGTSVTSVRDAVAAAVEELRAGRGPVMIEANVVRLMGHYNRDIEHYLTKEEKEEQFRRDPLPLLRTRLLEEGASDAAVSAVEEDARAQIDRLTEEVLALPLADPSTAGQHVVRSPSKSGAPRLQDGKIEELTYAQALNRALETELRTRPETIVFGEDVAIPGGIFGVTRNLRKQFGPERVFDTPIAESAILGSAVGAAIDGLRPIVEIMWADFLLVALDQLINQAANFRYINRGKRSLPLVVRTQQGAMPGSCSQHSQSLEALLAHIPGLRVGLPATPQDAYGMLRAAVNDPDPVVIIESRRLYLDRGPVSLASECEPIGRARLHRDGNDVTIICWGTMVPAAIEAASAMEEDGISAGVLDLRWLSPLDDEALEMAVERTKCAVIAHEANRTGGFGAEVAARISERHFSRLRAPITRIATPDVRIPAAPSLQAALVPDAEAIRSGVTRLVEQVAGVPG